MKKIHCLLIAFILCVFLSPVRAEQEKYALPSATAATLMLGGPVIDELALKDTDISKAIEIIAQKSGLNIIAGKDVRGNITVFLKHVDAREALRTVLESGGFASVEEGGIIRVMAGDEFKSRYGYAFGQDLVSKLVKLHVMPLRDAFKILDEMKSAKGKLVANEEAGTIFIMDDRAKVKEMERLLIEVDVPVSTAVITLRHVMVEALVPEVRGLLTRGIGAVDADAKANTLTVTDTLARVEKVRRAVAAADARGRVMVLEAKLVRILLDDEHRGGVDWAGIVEDYQRVRLPAGYDFLAEGNSGRALGLGMIASDEFATLIEALDTVGIVQEYPLSSVMVSGDDQASALLRLDDPLLAIAAEPVLDTGKEALPRALAGTSMEFKVRPSFDVTGDVVTAITLARSHLAGKVVMAPERFHTLSSREGYTAVIGGILISEQISAAHKIPLLGDLPLLGFAFRMDGAVRHEEFAVFLTVRSVSLSQAFSDEGADLPGGEP